MLFVAGSAFWAWIIFGDGADRLEGRFISGFLFWYRAPEWTAQDIRLFAAGTWCVHAIWFVMGLFFPEIRLMLP
jgi:hypothetical protein